MRVWLIDEGSHGHRAQSRGVVAAIERTGRRVEVVTIEARDRVPGVLRAPIRLAVDRGTAALADRAAHLASRFAPPTGAAPDLVLSSGGKSVFANVALARATGAPNLFVGDPRPYPPRWFGAVLAPSAIAGATNVHTIAAPPTPMTPAHCREAATRHWPDAPPGRVWALLVGGASRSHRFKADDFEALADGVNALARRFGIRWVVSTSRRSGATADAVLAERLAPEAVVETTLFSRRPTPVAAAYLGVAERVFVTQDSLTMLSEAIASDRPVVAVAPVDVRLPWRSIETTMLERFDRLPGFERRTVATMADYEPSAREGGAAAAVLDVLDRTVVAVLAELNLDRPAR